MTIRGIVIMPEGTTGPEPGKPYRVSGENNSQLRSLVGIDFGERVHPPAGRAAGFVCLMDGDAMTRGLTLNPVAQEVMAYPKEHNIRGPVIFLCEDYVYDDDMPGIDFISLRSGPTAWILGALGLSQDYKLEDLPRGTLQILPPEQREVPKFKVPGIGNNLSQDEVIRYLSGGWREGPNGGAGRGSGH
jgi:hypothetical protein